MKRLKLFGLQNAMLFANLISNVIGVSVVMLLTHSAPYSSLDKIQGLAYHIDAVFIPCAFIVPWVVTILYERPIRHYLNLAYRTEPITRDLALTWQASFLLSLTLSAIILFRPLLIRTIPRQKLLIKFHLY